MSVLRSLSGIGLALIGALQLAACTTVVRGGRPSPDHDGVHYWLPMPIVKVTPMANGQLTVTTDSIPDSRHEYVLSAQSILSKYTFEVKVVNGLLTDVTMDSESTATTEKLIEASSEFEKTRVAAEVTALEAREAAVKAREAAIKTATANVLAKKRALQQLQDKRAELIRQGNAEDSDEVRAVDLEIVNARRELEFAEEDLATLLDDDGSLGNQDAGGARAAHDGSGPVAWGPVVYRVEQWIDGDGLPNVRLVAASWPDSSSQVRFRTATSAGDAPEPPKPRPNVQFQIDGPSALEPKDGRIEMTVIGPIELFDVSGGGLEKFGRDDAAGKADLSLQPDRKRVVITMPPDLPDGQYFVRIDYRIEQNDKAQEQRILFRVRRP